MVLINGIEGIGTGFSSKVPKYNPIEIVDILLKKINNDEKIL
jgi:DNA gyrase/topoisomerase IV subunit A